MDPSIEYLELFAVTVSVLLWLHKVKNTRICLFTDNESVKNMINNTSSSCKNCMVLIRIIVLKALEFNVRIEAKHVSSKSNLLADSLSRMQFGTFFYEANRRGLYLHEPPETIPSEVWPVQNIWKC